MRIAFCAMVGLDAVRAFVVPISDLGGLTSVLGKGDAFISGGHTS
jgi:hypothetical protein